MSLFNVYDGPGPVRRVDVTRLVHDDWVKTIYRDAVQANGLYRTYTAPIVNPQARALNYAPGVRWTDNG